MLKMVELKAYFLWELEPEPAKKNRSRNRSRSRQKRTGSATLVADTDPSGYLAESELKIKTQIRIRPFIALIYSKSTNET